MTSMEDDLHGRWNPWKMKSMEDDFNGSWIKTKQLQDFSFNIIIWWNKVFMHQVDPNLCCYVIILRGECSSRTRKNTAKSFKTAPFDILYDKWYTIYRILFIKCITCHILYIIFMIYHLSYILYGIWHYIWVCKKHNVQIHFALETWYLNLVNWNLLIVTFFFKFVS